MSHTPPLSPKFFGSPKASNSASNSAPNLGGGAANSNSSENSDPNHEGGGPPNSAIDRQPSSLKSAGDVVGSKSQPAVPAAVSNAAAPQDSGAILGGSEASVNSGVGSNAPPRAQTSNQMSSFGFKNCFEGQNPSGNAQLFTSELPTFPPNQSAAPSAGSQPDGGRSAGFSGVDETSISRLSAEILANFIKAKVPNFNPEAWIKEQISGAALVEAVDPKFLNEFLEQTALITSAFARTRVGILLHAMVAKDPLVGSDIKAIWRSSKGISSAVAADPLAVEAFTPTSKTLFTTPAQSAGDRPQYNLGGAEAQPSRVQGEPSFLSEIRSSRGNFSFDDSALFSSERVHENSRVSMTPSVGAVLASPGAAGNPMQLNITLNQPAAKPPNYPILQSATTVDEVYSWLKACRKESAHCMPVDKRPLHQLCSEEVKNVVSRLIVVSRTKDPALFDAEAPNPSNWPAVTDRLLLRVLLGIVGPCSAEEAKSKLKKIIFFFNDSTTNQALFTHKLRKHCLRFTQDLGDFSYSSRRWPKNDVLSHNMIVEAFASGFSSTETIKNKEGSAQVPRCSNLATIRDLIRENKSKPDFTLDDIINVLLDYFEAIDVAVRTRRGVGYEITPWIVQNQKNKKRKFGQLSAQEPEAVQGGGGAAVNQVTQRPVKTVRPNSDHPRCNNCGSKGHLCSERTCFLWGAPGALGAKGNWPEGTPSLKLSKEDWIVFSKDRKDIFYSYPENQGKGKPKS